MSENTKMAITRKGLWVILMGLVVMVAGFILMMGGGVKDPNVFNWAMFDFRRLVAANIDPITSISQDIKSTDRSTLHIKGWSSFFSLQSKKWYSGFSEEFANLPYLFFLQ